jgi:hypothetical protein
VADDARTITLTRADVPGFRAAVVASAHAGEGHLSERLLGQLASLEAGSSAERLAFVPADATASLARRALDHLHRAAGR